MEYTNTACETNSIELSIYVNDLTNPYLEFTLVDGTIKNTDILSIIDSFISYEIPFEYYSTNGTINMRIRAEGYNSKYIGFTISKNLNEIDNIIVKTENNKYLIKAMATSKQIDLPIATTSTLGGIIVGDNLVIDSSGRLSSTGEGLAATVEIGTTKTGESGTNASVTNSGTSNAAVLDFVIPKGDKGTDGKSSYQIWLDQGNTGTEQEFLDSQKGATGESGVYIGTLAPTDESINVWIDPSGDSEVNASEVTFTDGESLQTKYDNGDLGSGSGTGTSNYTNLSDKPKINNVELIGNKTLEELGIQQSGNYLTNVPSEYITETELNAKGYLTEHQDLSSYTTKIYVDTLFKSIVDGNEVSY